MNTQELKEKILSEQKQDKELLAACYDILDNHELHAYLRLIKETVKSIENKK